MVAALVARLGQHPSRCEARRSSSSRSRLLEVLGSAGAEETASAHGEVTEALRPQYTPMLGLTQLSNY